ncbi:hypothetical protein LSH36_706g01026 [Paralvinella palmiformis]|uniref:Peptidase M14 domain-containing protein n=1 Tax=Paralvinella palmiformis TaxID=53620 RepID=A0AAD9J2S8_9ANNE|nr:hypothetical protein LSH36_706g01026 [Paralvinella palmiformis]
MLFLQTSQLTTDFNNRIYPGVRPATLCLFKYISQHWTNVNLKMILVTVGFILLVHSLPARTDSGDDVIKVIPHTSDELSHLIDYLNNEALQGHIDIWTMPKNVDKDGVFKIAHEYKIQTEAWLTKEGMDYSIITGDIERLIMNEEADKTSETIVTRSRLQTSDVNLKAFNDHNNINTYLRISVGICDICRLISIGKSYQNREMLVIKLINGYHRNDSDIMWLLDHFVYYILPSANPDGYMYSREYDRMWRKTRKPTLKVGCVGSDPNRNWKFHWAESGVSFNRCSGIFPGEHPFSEVEMRNIRRFLWRYRNRFIVYLSLHSYGQQWLYPWGYDDSLPEDWKELDRVGQRATNKIRDTSGADYELGSSTHLLYAAAGVSDDWAKAVAGIKYSYAVELADLGEYGFFMPAELIQPSFDEFWPALPEMSKAVQEFLDGIIH